MYSGGNAPQPSSGYHQAYPTLSKIDSGFYSDTSGMPPPSQPQPFNHTFDPLGMYNLSSRSTSVNTAPFGYQYAANAAFIPRLSQQMPAYNQVKIRLPSDQVRQIVDALSPHQASSMAAVSGVNMAQVSPPTSRENDGLRSSKYGFFRGMPPAAMHATTGQRPNSFGSDISMHPACTQFPSCTVDDPCGTDVIHNPVPTETNFADACTQEDETSNEKTTLHIDDRPASLVISKKGDDRGRKRDHGLLNDPRGNSPRKVSKTAKEGFAMTVEEIIETGMLGEVAV